MKKISVISIGLLLATLAFSQVKSVTGKVNSNGVEFIPNKGQIADRYGKVLKNILFSARLKNAQVYLRDTGISYVVRENLNLLKDSSSIKTYNVKGSRLDMDFVGSIKAEVEGLSPTAGHFNFYYPQCPNGINDVKAYSKIRYKNIYKNIDVIYLGETNNGLEYDIVVNPEGSLPDIKMRYTGAPIKLKDGKLFIAMPKGDMLEYMPKIYQEINGKQKEITGSYRFIDSSGSRFTVGIDVKTYDRKFPLVIDPWWATYFGGSTDDYGNAVAIDKHGNTIITGMTLSTDFPATAGAFQATYGGGSNTPYLGGGDAFVARFDTHGNRLWATYYGGDTDEVGLGIATDAQCNVAITGFTQSQNFPVSFGCAQFTFGGTPGTNAFAVKFDSNGHRLWGTYFGAGTDFGYGISIDGKGNVIFVGNTASSNFPVTGGAFQPGYAGGPYSGDAFIVKLNAAGNLLWSTFCGGSGQDGANGVAVDGANNIVVSGFTQSANFPVSVGAFQPALAGGGSWGDAFLMKFDPSGNRLWGTYFGGSNDDFATGVVCDKNNNIVFTGGTISTNLPVSIGAYQATLGLLYHYSSGFIAKFNSNGARVWATYNNLTGTERGGLAIDADGVGNIYTSDMISNLNSPPKITSCGFDTGFRGNSDEYITKFDSSGNYSCSSYVGGTEDFQSYIQEFITTVYPAGTKNLAVRAGKMALTGFSGDVSPTSSGAFQDSTRNHAADNAYIINLCTFACGDTNAGGPSGISIKDTVQGKTCSSTVNFSILETGRPTCDTMGVIYSWEFPGGIPSSAIGRNVNGVYYKIPGTYPVTLIISACSIDSIKKNIVVDSGFGISLSTIKPTSCNPANGSATVTPVGGIAPFTYIWSNGATTQTISGVNSGSYTCVAVDLKGCKDSVKFILPSPITLKISASPDTICSNTSSTLKVSGARSYTWTPSLSLSCATCATTIATPTTTTIYSVTGIDSVGCTDTATITVVVKPIFNASIVASKDSVCPGVSTNLSVASATALTYNWTPVLGLSCTSCPNPISTPSVTTTYTLITNSYYGCTDTLFKTITVNPVPNVSISVAHDSICKGDSTVLNASGANTYSWSPSTGLNCTNCANPDASPSATTTYFVTGTNKYGCQNQASGLVIYVLPAPTFKGGSNICKGFSTSLSVVAAPGSIYAWSTGATTSSILVSPSATSTYSSIVRTKACVDTFYSTIDVNLPLSINACCDTAIFNGQSVQLIASGSASYAWSPIDGLSCTTCANPFASPTQTTLYYITVVSDSGCISRDSLLVIVDNCNDFFVPDAFSPNGDGHNDILYVRGSCIQELNFEIFDRWGNRVFESLNKELGWDGKYNGSPMNPGTYVYYAKIVTTSGQTIMKKGNVTLIR